MAARIVFVTGKGGTGKSSIASSLAREAALRGETALVIRMADNAGASDPDEDTDDSSSGELRSDDALRGDGARRSTDARPEVRVLDAHRDLEGFLTRVLGLSFIVRRLQQSSTFGAVAAAAPGLRDLVALTAVTAEARRRRGLVVVDAPATGHSLPMLTAPSRVRELTPFGPVAREADFALRVLADPRAFSALLVTTPEELAITEVRGLRAEVLEAGVGACRVVVNGLWPAYVSADDGDAIARSAVSADATMHWRRHRRQASLVEELEREVGRCTRIGFSFGRSIGSTDIAALFDEVTSGAAR